MLRFTSALLIILLIYSCRETTTVSVTTSSPGNFWKQETTELPRKVSGETVVIDRNADAQTIDGFGGCFNELGWDVLQLLEEPRRDSILGELFTPGKGMSFSLCRMPIGANDYARNWYSLNETPGDFIMQHFSIARDRTALIPYILAAKKFNPALKIWASPWCPPSWMKKNNHYACRKDPVNDYQGPDGQEMQGDLIWEPEYLKAYAHYFSKFINYYKVEGIDIYAVQVQNEPNSCQNFPSCIWEPWQLRDFIRDYLAPQFKTDRLSTEIWLGTIERPQLERIDTILADPAANAAITGVGFQWAGKGAIPLVAVKYPQKKLMQTETECGDGSNDWAAAIHTWELMKLYFSAGANAYLYWNIILDETGKSTWSWKQNSMISVDRTTRKVTFNPEFYLMKHFSHFVKPGAVKLKTAGGNLLVFRNPDGELVVVASNQEPQPQKLTLQIDGLPHAVTLPPVSFTTIQLPAPPK